METTVDQANSADMTDQIIALIENISDERKLYLLALLKKWHGQKERLPRKDCLIPVDYTTQDRMFSDFIQDISASGVFIETKEPFLVGQDITLTFTILSEENPFKITGEIVRTDTQGIAVKFTNLTEYREWIIKSLLEEMSGGLKK